MRILIIRLGAIGDTILVSSLFSDLKKQEIKTDLLTDKNIALIFKEESRLNKVMGINRKAFNFRAVKELSVILKKENYDYVFDLHAIPKTKLLTKLLPFKTITYNKHSLLRREILIFKFLKRKYNLYVPELYAKALRKAGIKIAKNPKPEIFIPEQTERKISKFLPPMKFIVIAPGAKWEGKIYPPEKFKKVGNTFKKLGYAVLTVGGKENSEIGREIAGSDRFNLCGKLSLIESMAVMKHARVVIASDSSATHMAKAVKTKIAVIYGATHPCFGFAPLPEEGIVIKKELPCNPCSLHGKVRCFDRKCLDISPKDVVKHTLEMMIKSGVD